MSAAASRSTSAEVTFTDGWSASPIFSSSRDSRCWLEPTRATSSFAASGSSWRPSSRACPMHHLGSSHGFGAAYSRVSPPAFSTAFASCFTALPRAISTSTVSGGSSAERVLQRAELGGLPGAHVVDQQVAGGGVEAEHRERAGDLGRLALARVEGLEAAGAALLLGAPAHAGAPGVDLGVVVAADEVGGLQLGHGPESTGGRSGARQRSVVTRMAPCVDRQRDGAVLVGPVGGDARVPQRRQRGGRRVAVGVVGAHLDRRRSPAAGGRAPRAGRGRRCRGARPSSPPPAGAGSRRIASDSASADSQRSKAPWETIAATADRVRVLGRRRAGLVRRRAEDADGHPPHVELLARLGRRAPDAAGVGLGRGSGGSRSRGCRSRS